MSEAMTTPGAFSWVELMTADPEAAKKFYGQLFGWTFEKQPGFGGYEIIKLNGKMAAGLMPMPPGCPPGTPPSWGQLRHRDQRGRNLREGQGPGRPGAGRPAGHPDGRQIRRPARPARRGDLDHAVGDAVGRTI